MIVIAVKTFQEFYFHYIYFCDLNWHPTTVTNTHGYNNMYAFVYKHFTLHSYTRDKYKLFTYASIEDIKLNTDGMENNEQSANSANIFNVAPHDPTHQSNIARTLRIN